MKDALFTQVVCRKCSTENRVGAVLCENQDCRAVLQARRIVTQDADPDADLGPVTMPEASSADIDNNDDIPRFVVIENDGVSILEAAKFEAHIPLIRLFDKDMISIGRRARPHPDFEPHMDFGFLFYNWTEGRDYPISRKGALLYGEKGTLKLRRVGRAPIRVRRQGKGKALALQKYVTIKVENGDVLCFGNLTNHFKVVIRGVTQEILDDLD